MSKFNCQYYPLAPSNTEEWENLITLSGNPYQSTYFDKIEAKYNNVPVYFLCKLNETLIGGIKIYIYESKKLPPLLRNISKSAHVISEPCIHPDYYEKNNEIYSSLVKCIEQYFAIFKPVTFTLKTTLGLSPLILSGKKKEITYGIAYVELKRSFEETYATFSSNARQECRTAIKKNVKIEKSEHIDEALKLFDYSRNLPGFSSASNNHLMAYFNALNTNNMCDLWIAWYENRPVSTVFVTKKGKNCFYEFGTSIRTNSGSGYFIHSEIMKYYTANGYEKYYLGQIATNAINNPKFEKGITFFKMQFKPQICSGVKNEYIFAPLKHYLWKTLIKLTTKK